MKMNYLKVLLVCILVPESNQAWQRLTSLVEARGSSMVFVKFSKKNRIEFEGGDAFALCRVKQKRSVTSVPASWFSLQLSSPPHLYILFNFLWLKHLVEKLGR